MRSVPDRAATDPVAARPRLGRWWPLLLLGAGLALFLAFDGSDLLTLDALRAHRAALMDWVARRPIVAPVAATFIYAAAVAFSLPVGLLLTVVAGLLFGPVLGTAVAVVGATTGAVILFLAARLAFGGRLRVRVEHALCRMDAGFRENAFNYLLVLRLVPIFPFWLVNLAPAFTEVPLRTYALATAIGVIPGTLVYVLVGNGLGAVLEAGGTPDLGIILTPAVLAPLIGLALLALLPVLLRRWRRGPVARHVRH